ncbi:TPA: energy transducer TonB [Candidatus Poribacteria bacterium]|nr:energy transducer TonB [Candidatus Poribacteria bacterium]
MKLQTKKKSKVIQISLSISIIAHIVAIVIYVASLSHQEEQNTNAIFVEMLKMPSRRSVRRPRHKPRVMELHPLEENQSWQKPVAPSIPIQITSESVFSTYADLELDSSSYLREPVKETKFTADSLNTLYPFTVHLIKSSVIRPVHKFDNIDQRNKWNFDMPTHIVELDSIESVDLLCQTRHDELSAFQTQIREKIEKAKRYPPLARKKGFEGVVQLKFCILQDGRVKEVFITTPSEYEILDNAAVETIRRAQPYPKIPKTLTQNSLWIELSIVFELKGEG